MLLRRRMMGKSGGSIPYQRIEYLESTGTQYIGTNIIPDSLTGARCVVYTIGNNDSYFIGCRTNTSNTRWTIGCYNATTYYYGYGLVGGNSNFTNKVECCLNYLNNKLFTVKKDNFSNSHNLASLGFTPTYTIHLFAPNGQGATNRWVGRIFHVEISQENSILADFVPVRIGTTGYMYDTVSGELLGNSGTGDFVLGPDVN